MGAEDEGGGRFYLGLRLECGADATREGVAEGLRRLAAAVWPSRGGTAVMFLLFLFMAIVMVGASLLLYAFSPQLAPVSLFLALFSFGLALRTLRESSRRSDPARALLGLAGLVEMGLVAPEEVCGRSVEELVGLYRRRSAGLPPGFRKA